MFGLDTSTLIILLLIVFIIGNFIIGTEWAKYGLFVLPANGLALSMFSLSLVTLVTFMIICLKQDYSLIDKYVLYWKIGIIVPWLWALYYRLVLIRPGVLYINQAVRLVHEWKKTYLVFGQRSDELEKSFLYNVSFAGTIKRLYKAIRLNRRANVIKVINEEHDFNDGIRYTGSILTYFLCPNCKELFGVHDRDRMDYIQCDNCEGNISYFRDQNKVLVEVKLRKSIKKVTGQRRSYIAIAYYELAQIYRMYGNISRARKMINQARDFALELYTEHHYNRDYTRILSQVNFCLAEIEEVDGNFEMAKELYIICKRLDKSIGVVDNLGLIDRHLESM